MAEPMAVQPAGEASAEVTYALRVCDGVRLVIEARWHAGNAAFDVQVTDGASVWRKHGVSAPPTALTADLTLDEWMAAARAALADVAYERVSFIRSGGGLKLSWEWELRSHGELQVSNTGVEPLAPVEQPAAAAFELLCGSAHLAGASAAQAARCVAAAAALREELQRTADEAAIATAAKAATEKELYQKFALVLNEKKKKIEDVLASREAVQAELEDAQFRLQAAGLQERPSDSGEVYDRGGSSGGSSGGDEDEEEAAPTSALAAPAQLTQRQPSQQQPVPMETAKPAAAVAFGRSRAPKIKYETPPADVAAAPASQRAPPGGSQQPRARAAPVAALAHIQHFASLAPKDESDEQA